MGRYYNDCLFHSYDYSDFPESEYEETEEYEVLSRYWDDALAHAGIKGMHWGQRRYQNEDGSYTEAGMIRRYGHGHLSGPRHFGSSRSAYRTGARSSSQRSKHKGMSTGAKVALAAAGLAAAGAAGYAMYRGRKANNARSEGWNREKLNEYQRKNNESMEEYRKAYSAWDKSRKTHTGGGYRFTDHGDADLERAMEAAKQKNAADGAKLIDYMDRDPEKLAELRKRHKISSAIDDFATGVDDIRRHGIIDNRKPTGDSLQKNFSSAFDKERKGPNLDAVKEKVGSVKDKVDSLRRSNSNKPTGDSLQKNFSKAFDKPKEKSSRGVIDGSILTKEQQDDINRQIDKYNEAVRNFNKRFNKNGSGNTSAPKSNLQMGPNMSNKPSQEVKKTESKPAQKQKTREDFDFDNFDKMMSRGDTTFNLNTGKFTVNDPVDDYTQELLKRNRKTINSMR